MTTGALAALISVAILAQSVIAVLFKLSRARNAAAEGLHAEPAPSAGPVDNRPAWEGFREFRVCRRVTEDAGGSICSFYLAPVDGKPLPPFKPGQFLTFQLPITAARESGSVLRCYSLSDCPRPDGYRISIKRIPAPPGRPELPPGLSSNFFHDQVHEGSRLMVKAPSGHFHLQEDESRPVVLIGGGIGITPMLSMLNSLLGTDSTREVWLYYSVRNGAEQIMKEHLRALAANHDNLHLHVCYSSPGPGDVEGIDYRHRGRVDVHLLRNTLRLMRYQFYVCGPKAMMESLVPALEDWGVDPRDIHYEAFGPATLVRRPKHKATACAPPVTVTFSKSRKRLQWNPNAGSILEFAEANGIRVESGCRAGSCGCCQTALEDGETEYSRSPDAEVKPGHCLLCISIPKSDLTLAA